MLGCQLAVPQSDVNSPLFGVFLSTLFGVCCRDERAPIRMSALASLDEICSEDRKI